MGYRGGVPSSCILSSDSGSLVILQLVNIATALDSVSVSSIKDDTEEGNTNEQRVKCYGRI